MSRSLSPLLVVSSMLLSLGLAGCGTVYSDMYSPSRKRYVAPPEEKKAGPAEPSAESLLGPEPNPNLLPPANPVDPGMAPPAPIPGLEPIPSAPGEAAPGMTPADPAMAPGMAPGAEPMVPGL